MRDAFRSSRGLRNSSGPTVEALAAGSGDTQCPRAEAPGVAIACGQLHIPDAQAAQGHIRVGNHRILVGEMFR